MQKPRIQLNYKSSHCQPKGFFWKEYWEILMGRQWGGKGVLKPKIQSSEIAFEDRSTTVGGFQRKLCHFYPSLNAILLAWLLCAGTRAPCKSPGKQEKPSVWPRSHWGTKEMEKLSCLHYALLGSFMGNIKRVWERKKSLFVLRNLHFYTELLSLGNPGWTKESEILNGLGTLWI